MVIMKAVIIDDELNNIKNLSALLSEYCPVVHIVGTALTLEEGIEIIRKNDIDMLFLDIQFPNKTGFDLLNELTVYTFQIIFVTAFDNYAIRAIKYAALDYLLKPINVKELVEAVNKVEEKTKISIYENQIKNLRHYLSEKNLENANIGLPLTNGIRFVDINEIIYCHSENNYSIFNLTGNEKIIVSKGLYEYEELLPKKIFIRCHQSYLVNKTFVKSLYKEDGIYFLQLKSGVNIPVSRAKKEFVKCRLVTT